MNGTDSPSRTCQLCERDVPREMITLHHLKPKEKGGKAEDRTPLCRPCHKQLHAVYSNADLAKSYADLPSLRSATELQGFLKWIKKQQPHRTFRTAMSEGHPLMRRRRNRR